MALRLVPNYTRQLALTSVRAMSSEFGSGAGKGGGSGGSIRDAGGAFGKQEAAREEQYFRKLQEKQLQEMKEHYHKLHLDEIKRHEEAIKDHKKAIEDLQKKDRIGSDSD